MRSAAHIKSHPIHAILVSFPIGLLVTSFIFDAIAVAAGQPRLWATGWYCVVAGVVGGFLAAVPGVIDLFSVVPPQSSAKQRGYLHGGLNLVMLGLFITVAVHRGGPDAAMDKLSLALSGTGVLLIGFTGWLGGTLVYRNQIGVDHRYASAGTLKERTLDSWDRPVCNQSELAEGQMMLATIANQRVVIGRCPEGYAAFSDHCTHMGGPLSDGALIGCTVQCPWHGSQFDINTGRVVAGPAKKKIEIYEVEVRKGEVYVVRSDNKKDDKKKAA
jgi:uncharacterized membrane protein/nitrite reductase/ring-hydroxylating ferredoxin subunit